MGTDTNDAGRHFPCSYVISKGTYIREGDTVTVTGFRTVPTGQWTFKDLPILPMRLECKMELYMKALRRVVK